MVHGSDLGVHALRGGGEVTTMPLVPNGIRGCCPTPRSARSSWAAAKIPIPQNRVGSRLPISKYRHRRFNMPTPNSAVAFALGSWPCVEVLWIA